MKILVKAKLFSKRESIEKIDNNYFLIKVKEPPTKGMANKAIIKTLSTYFKVKLSDIKLISGTTSKNKIFEINMN